MKVLLVGDSHTFGTYGQSLEAILKAAGHDVTRVGWVGAAAYHYLAGKNESLKMGGTGNFAAAKAGSYDLAIVSLGTNDAAGWPAATAAQSIRRLIGELSASRKVWVGPPAFSANAAATYNPAFKTKNLNVRAQELYDAMAGGTGYATLDPRSATSGFVKNTDIHFGPKGGQAWAQFVADSVLTSAPAAVAVAVETEPASADEPVKQPEKRGGGATVWLVAVFGVAALLWALKRRRAVGPAFAGRSGR